MLLYTPCTVTNKYRGIIPTNFLTSPQAPQLHMASPSHHPEIQQLSLIPLSPSDRSCHPVRFPLQINRLMENFRTVVQILDKSDDAIRFMIGNIFNLRSSFILEVNGQFRIQVCSLMKPALYLCC